MFCTKRSYSIRVLTMVSGISTVLCGCNVDGMSSGRRAPKGPIASPSAELARITDSAGTEVALDGNEVDLVEAVVNHRALYLKHLEQLRDYYKDHGYATKQGWADFELKGLKSVKSFRYITDAEVPAVTLQPSESIPEADAQYQRATELMKQGGHGVPIFYRQKVMIEAADVLRDLVDRYPNSDKVDDAAFLLGEIHKEYLPGQEMIAVKWYERCWVWNPQTPHPARFQAAVVYDYRLHDRDRALELYRATTEVETDNQSNYRFALRRIDELTSEKRTSHASSR